MTCVNFQMYKLWQIKIIYIVSKVKLLRCAIDPYRRTAHKHSTSSVFYLQQQIITLHIAAHT